MIRFEVPSHQYGEWKLNDCTPVPAKAVFRKYTSVKPSVSGASAFIADWAVDLMLIRRLPNALPREDISKRIAVVESAVNPARPNSTAVNKYCLLLIGEEAPNGLFNCNAPVPTVATDSEIVFV